ncbi:MAG: SH3 domain-containing protein [Chloroflexi bacterium]|nr:SH3 domain-containing protein [Chloroflexota bacterium]
MRPSSALLARWGGLSAALLLGFSLLFRNPVVTAAPAAAPECTVVSLALNLRAGPGLSYNPPLRALTKGTVLTPLARNAATTWIQVQIGETAESGWVSAAAPYVRCNIALSELPTPPVSATANPTPSSAPVAPMQSTPTPPPTSLATTDRQVTLLTPDNHSSIVSGRPTFRWQANFTLPPNTAFEVVFWQDQEDPLTQSQGGVPPTDKTEVGIDLDVLDQLRIIQSGLNHWGILLVQPQTESQPYRRLAFLQGDFDFIYSPVPPTPTPTETPTRTPRP